MKGLNDAIARAKPPRDDSIVSKIAEKFRGKPEEEEADLRPYFNEVAESDLRQGGVGFQATLFLEEDYSIGALEMTRRTKSPFSATMGAHSTAWVAHLDAVHSLLIKKTIPEALKACKPGQKP